MMDGRAILVLACALGAAACADLRGQLAKPVGADLLESAASIGPAAIDGRFRLVDEQGRTVTEASYAGRPRLVYFGYSSCPEICGLELQTMGLAADSAGAGPEDLALIFVTIDPARDKSPGLGVFVRQFHPDLVALSGDEQQISRAAKSFRVNYRRNADDMGDASYTMDHSTFIYLLDDENRYVRAFSYKTPPDVIAAEVTRLMRARAVASAPS